MLHFLKNIKLRCRHASQLLFKRHSLTRALPLSLLARPDPPATPFHTHHTQRQTHTLFLTSSEKQSSVKGSQGAYLSSFKNLCECVSCMCMDADCCMCKGEFISISINLWTCWTSLSVSLSMYLLFFHPLFSLTVSSWWHKPPHTVRVGDWGRAVYKGNHAVGEQVLLRNYKHSKLLITLHYKLLMNVNPMKTALCSRCVNSTHTHTEYTTWRWLRVRLTCY